VTIARVGAAGEIMIDDKMPHNVDAQLEQAKPEQQQSQANAADPPRQPAAPGRRPLFRN